MRPTSSRAIVAIVLAAVVLTAIAANRSGALAALPTKVVLGLSVPLLYGAALAAIGKGAPSRDQGLGGHRGAVEDAAAEEGELQPGSEVEQVFGWRRTRLASLGVREDAALVFAADARFSVHDLERLLAAGCPLGTALRIVKPV